MIRPLRLAVLGLCLFVASCATADRYGAAPDIHAFLISVRDNDRATFEAHVDRTALRRRLEAEMIARARSSNLSSQGQMAAALLAEPLAKLAGDTLIRPSVFRSAAVYLGYSPDKAIPGSIAIAQALRPIGPGQVCAAKKTGDCLLTFTREDGVWRLTDFGGGVADLGREVGR